MRTLLALFSPKWKHGQCECLPVFFVRVLPERNVDPHAGNPLPVIGRRFPRATQMQALPYILQQLCFSPVSLAQAICAARRGCA